MSHRNVMCRGNSTIHLVKIIIPTAYLGILHMKYCMLPCVSTRVEMKL